MILNLPGGMSFKGLAYLVFGTILVFLMCLMIGGVCMAGFEKRIDHLGRPIPEEDEAHFQSPTFNVNGIVWVCDEKEYDSFKDMIKAIMKEVEDEH